MIPPGSPIALRVEKLADAYQNSSLRMFFLDYDGTLSPIVSKPEDALPSQDLKHLISTLAENPKNLVYIISGRDRKSLECWLGDLPVGLSAEHGCFLRVLPSNGATQTNQWKDLIRDEGINLNWREKVISVFNKFAEQAPGCNIERKEYAITFHYRRCEKQLSKATVESLKTELDKLMREFPTLDVRKGKKSIEARIRNITKGFVVKRILDLTGRETVDFVLSIGDDLTDEDMFIELASETQVQHVFTCRVNCTPSRAKAYIENQKQVLETLQVLADTDEQF